MTSTTYSDTTPTVTYFYDQTSYNVLTITNGLGRRTGMSDGSGQTAWSYDAAGQVLTEQRTISGVTKAISYTYNLGGSVATIAYPSGRTITYSYSNAARPISAVDSANSLNYALSGSYAPQGALASLLHGQIAGGFAGITASSTYNNRLEPATIQATSSNGTVLNLTYSFSSGGGNNGSVYSITNSLNTDRTQTFTYDELNRIGTAQSQATAGAACWGQSFGYDRYSNLLSASVTKCSAPGLSVSVNSNNRITNTGFTYDAAGNMTNDGSYAYGYDAEERVNSAAGVTYTFDGNGKRVKKSSGRLYWNSPSCGQGALFETDLSGNLLDEYVFLGGRRIARRTAAGGVYYFFRDHLSSNRVVTSATGTVAEDSDYYPFGGELVFTHTLDNNYKFIGHERDTESGLDYYKFRMLSSRIGRWTAPDPVMASPQQPQSLDRYGYANNNPTNLTDPLGSFLGGEDEPVPQDRVSCELSGGTWAFNSWLDEGGYCQGSPYMIYGPNRLFGGGGGGGGGLCLPDLSPCSYYRDLIRNGDACDKAYGSGALVVCLGTGADLILSCFNNCVRSCLIDKDKKQCRPLGSCESRIGCRVRIHKDCFLACAEI